MKVRLVLFACLFLSFILQSEKCSEKKQKEKIEKLLPGYAFYDAPNDLDRTGLIFRVTPEGQRFNVGYVQVAPDNGRIEIKTTAQQRSMSLNALINFLKLDKSNLKIDGEFNLNRKVTFKMKIADNKQEALTDFTLDEKLKEALEIIKKNRTELGRQDDKYYIIRESILTKNMEYGLGSDIVTNAGIQLALNELLKVNTNVKFDNSKEFQLNFNYPDPLRVFYKAEYLSILSSATGSISIKRRPVSDEELYTNFNR